jgi:hypothetical protein
MNIFFCNTDNVPNAEALWIRHGVAVLSGGEEWRRKFNPVKPGDCLALWANGIGVCALGTALPEGLRIVTDHNRINVMEQEEYHLPVEWKDYRDSPMPYSEFRLLALPNASFKNLGAAGPKVLDWFARHRAVPVADREDCDERAEALLLGGPIQRPLGYAVAATVPGSSAGRYRCPWVRAWTLQRAGQQCELCNQTAFLKRSGRPYLESHHIDQLAAGGPDTPDNTAAVCANCHRELHHGRNASVLSKELRRVIAEKEARYLTAPRQHQAAG